MFCKRTKCIVKNYNKKSLTNHKMEKWKDYNTFFGGYAKIYALSTLDGNVFYVGCTVMTLEERISGHISEARYPKKHNKKNRKVNYISEINFQFTASVIDIKWVTGRDKVDAISKAKGLEKEYISKYRALGYDLVNWQPIKEIKKTPPEYIGKQITILNGVIVKEEKVNPNPCLTY